jgi:hypothetical protein
MGILRRLLIAVPFVTGMVLVIYGIIITAMALWVLRGFRDDGTSRLNSYMNWWESNVGTPVLNWAQNR